MYANKHLAVVLALVAGQSVAQEAIKSAPVAMPAAVPTIGQLAEQARLKRQTEDSVRSGVAGTTNGPVGGKPAGMVIVPSSQIITDAAAPGGAAKAPVAEKKTVAKKMPPPEFIPAILGTYKRDGQHFVELGEMAGNAPFASGQVTPSGWTILAIGAKTVQLGKIDPKSGASKKITLQVSGM